MGSGDIGTNGSVHWQINYTDTVGVPDHKDLDDTKKHPGKPGADPRPPIGDGKAGSGLLRVTLRFNNPAEARKILGDALASLQGGPANIRAVTIDLPIRGFRPNAPNPANRDEWEIGVDW